MRKAFCILSLAASLALIGCGGNDTTSSTGRNSAPTATDGRGKPATTEGSGKAAAGNAGAITPDNTKIEFVGTKPGGKHDGGFKSFSGSIKPVDGDITKSTISVKIDTESLWADNPMLTNHLKSPDFFDVKKYPEASFTSTSIKAEAKEGNTHVITGDLTLHGTTKSVSIPAKVTTTDDAVTINGQFTIDRMEFGVAFNKQPVDNTVTVKVSSKVARK